MGRNEFVRIVNNISHMYAKHRAIVKAMDDAGVYVENDLFDRMMDIAIETLNVPFVHKADVVAGYIFGYCPEWIEEEYPEEAIKIKSISNAGELFDYLSQPML